MVTIGNATGYTGTITLGSMLSWVSTVVRPLSAERSPPSPTSSSASAWVADGDGTSSVQTIAYTLPSQITSALFGARQHHRIHRRQVGLATTLNNLEANKIIAPTAALPFNNAAGNTLNVNSVNGYGLLLANQAALTATTTFGVGTITSIGAVAPTGQASNVTPTLILTNTPRRSQQHHQDGSERYFACNWETSASDASNTFGGSYRQRGSISPLALCRPSPTRTSVRVANGFITLNNTTLAEFLALNSFATSRTITIGSATGATLAAAATWCNADRQQPASKQKNAKKTAGTR